MSTPNPYGPRRGLLLIVLGLALYAAGVALYVAIDKESWLADGAAGAYIIGSAMAGAGVGTLLSFGRNMAVVRILCALIVCVAGSIFGVVKIDLALNPPETPPSVAYQGPSSEDLALRARLESTANAKIVTFSAIIRLPAQPAPDVEARIRAAVEPYLCTGECPDAVLVEAPAVLDGDGDPLQLKLRRLTPGERAALDTALAPFKTP